MQLTVFGFLPLASRVKASLVCKKWLFLLNLNEDILWKSLLLEDFKEEERESFGSTYKEIFKNFVAFRAHEIDCDRDGRIYLLHQQINQMKELTTTQSCHAKSDRVTNFILDGKLTLNDALERSSPEYIRQKSSITTPPLEDFSFSGVEKYRKTHRSTPFNFPREECMRLGLTYEEVTHLSFSEYHVNAMRRGANYEDIKDLTALQVNAWIEYELTLEQALNPALRQDHLGAINCNFKYDDIIDLNIDQLNGLTSNLGLIREQVNHSWFTRYHTKAIKNGVLYEKVKGIDVEEVKKLLSKEDILSGQYVFHSHPVVTFRK